MKYQEFNFKKSIKKALKEIGFDEPTPIQEQAIPHVLEGIDIIGQAKTGTGKTAAFGLPILNKIDTENKSIQALIMTPTRELAQQVEKELLKFGQYMENFKSVCVYGGANIVNQIKELRDKPQVIIGTPGRLLDHIRRKTVKLENINTVVMDEADEMLKMGFLEDIESILEKTPENRQTLLFSATMPKPIINIADKYQKDAKIIKIESESLTVDKIDQYFYHIKQSSKYDLLIRLLDYYNFNSGIIFCNTKAYVDELTEKLQKDDFKAEAIHGDLKQIQRDRVMNNFRRGNLKILVATDVAARGIDVDNIDVIFNYDIPQEDEVYIHRIGRTGRAGKSGLAITFVNHRQKYRINSIEKLTNSKIKKASVPTVSQIQESRLDDTYSEIKHIIKNDTKSNELVNKLLLEGYTELDIINSLLNLHLSETQREYQDIEIVQPRVREKRSNDRSKNNRSNDNKKNDNYQLTKEDKQKVVIVFNFGKNEKLRPQILVSYLANRANADKRSLGNITIRKRETILETDNYTANKIMKSLKGKKYKSTKIEITKL